MKMGVLCPDAEDPTMHTTSPLSCMIWIICRVADGVQSVNSETSRGTLSTFSMCGRISSIPLGNLAYGDEPGLNLKVKSFKV